MAMIPGPIKIPKVPHTSRVAVQIHGSHLYKEAVYTVYLCSTHMNIRGLHPGRLTWNLKITYLKRKIIFQTSIIMFHVNLRGSDVDVSIHCLTKTYALRFVSSHGFSKRKWRLEALGGFGEWLLETVPEDHWLEDIRHVLVHQGTIPIAFNMSFEALMRTTPHNFTHL